MLILVSPYSFLYSLVYSFFFLALLSLSNFFSFWLCMELIMLIFMGLSYSMMRHSLSTLMVYFLVQSVASLVILISYLSGTEPLFSAALLLKMAAFPFSFWFVYATSRLPVFIFFLVCTTQKLPPILLLSSFNMQVVPSFLWTSCIFSVLLSGAFMLMSQDLRILLAASSIGTNGWLLIAQLTGPSMLFLYFLVYSMLLGLVLTSGQSFSPSPNKSFYQLILLGALSGLPPSPLFLAKLLIVMALPSSGFMVGLFLLSTVPMVVAYVVFVMNWLTFAWKAN